MARPGRNQQDYIRGRRRSGNWLPDFIQRPAAGPRCPDEGVMRRHEMAYATPSRTMFAASSYAEIGSLQRMRSRSSMRRLPLRTSIASLGQRCTAFPLATHCNAPMSACAFSRGMALGKLHAIARRPRGGEDIEEFLHRRGNGREQPLLGRCSEGGSDRDRRSRPRRGNASASAFPPTATLRDARRTGSFPPNLVVQLE